MSEVQFYIMIDDDAINNMLCTISMKRYLGESIEVKSFTEPEQGLEFIKKDFISNVQPAVLLLDVNMPTMSGWEFMEEFAKFPGEVKNNMSVYILSSSIEEQDKKKAQADKNITGFISKPLTKEILTSIAAGKVFS